MLSTTPSPVTSTFVIHCATSCPVVYDRRSEFCTRGDGCRRSVGPKLVSQPPALSCCCDQSTLRRHCFRESDPTDRLKESFGGFRIGGPPRVSRSSRR